MPAAQHLLSSILPNQVGYTLDAGDFRLRFVNLAGTGAYGLVYVAYDMSTSMHDPKFYAVKTMLKYEPCSELAAVQERELTFHKVLSHHPNISTLHHVIYEQHYVYLVMDYHADGDLFSAIMDRHTFAGDNIAVKSAFIQILDAVQACHDAGIAHRDLKPENILCSDRDTHFHLSDFGLSTMSDVSTSFGCGSTYYMSPENIGSFEGPKPYATQSSDVWSLGIILVNMLTGRNPWHIASAIQDTGYAQYLKGRACFLAEVLDISCEVAVLITRILEPNVSLRITIPDLRLAIQSVDSFFPPEDLSECFRYCAPRTCNTTPVSSDGSSSLLSFVYGHGAEEIPSADGPFDSIPLVDLTPVVEGCSSNYINHRVSVSTLESSAPATPETHATDPHTTIPPMSLSVRDPKRAIVHIDIAEPGKAHNPRTPRVQKTVQRFMGALHRLALRT